MEKDSIDGRRRLARRAGFCRRAGMWLAALSLAQIGSCVIQAPDEVTFRYWTFGREVLVAVLQALPWP